MKCPKCATEMLQVAFKEVAIDRCPACGGILLDKGETEIIDQLELGGVIEAGAQRDASADDKPAFCHACNKQMMALTGAGDVKYDWCDGCERIYFDRGELAAFDAIQHE